MVSGSSSSLYLLSPPHGHRHHGHLLNTVTVSTASSIPAYFSQNVRHYISVFVAAKTKSVAYTHNIIGSLQGPEAFRGMGRGAGGRPFVLSCWFFFFVSSCRMKIYLAFAIFGCTCFYL